MTEPQFERLSDREILILTCRETFNNSTRLDNHGKRINSLEKYRNWLGGATAVIVTILSFVIEYIARNK